MKNFKLFIPIISFICLVGCAGPGYYYGHSSYSTPDYSASDNSNHREYRSSTYYYKGYYY